MSAIATARRTMLAASVAALTVVGAVGAQAQSQGPAELTPVRVALNFQLQAYASPLLWGEAKGLFAAEGLDVEVLPTSGGDQAFQLMNEGQVEFSISDLDPLIQQHLAGQTDARIVYVLLDNPTMGIVSRTELASPADLQGKSFGTTQFSSGRTVVPFVMAANGADPAQLEVVPLDFSTLYPSLFEGAIDTAELHRPGSWQNLRTQAMAQGIDLYFVPLSDWGLKSYSKNVIARQAFIDENRDVVARFVRALDASVNDVLANGTPEEVFALLDAADAQLPEAPTLLDFEDFRASVSDPGPVDPAVVEFVLDLIRQTQGIETELSVDTLYTNEFIPAT